MDWLRIVGPEGTLEVFGVRLIGVSLASGKKLLFTVVWMLVVTILAASLRRIESVKQLPAAVAMTAAVREAASAEGPKKKAAPRRAVRRSKR